MSLPCGLSGVVGRSRFARFGGSGGAGAGGRGSGEARIGGVRAGRGEGGEGRRHGKLVLQTRHEEVCRGGGCRGLLRSPLEGVLDHLHGAHRLLMAVGAAGGGAASS